MTIVEEALKELELLHVIRLRNATLQEIKNGPGDVYIYPPEAKGCWEEYTYRIKPDGEQIKVTCDEEPEW